MRPVPGGLLTSLVGFAAPAVGKVVVPDFPKTENGVFLNLWTFLDARL